MSVRRKWWEVVGDLVRAQHHRRGAGRPELGQWRGGNGPRGPACVYLAGSQREAEFMHRHRVRALIRQRRAADALDPRPPHLDNPYCPECANPCGTTDREDVWSTSDDWVACAACGHLWHSAEDRAQAARADRAYAEYRAAERERERAAALLGPELLELNDRMVKVAEQRRASWRPAEQAQLFGGEA